MKVKIFAIKGDAVMVEPKINEWLNENKDIEISTIKQSYTYNPDNKTFHTLISVWY